MCSRDRADAHLEVEDAGTADVVRGKVALIQQNLDDVNRYWDEQTHGLRAGPDGALYTRDGKLAKSPEDRKRRRRSDRHSGQVRGC